MKKVRACNLIICHTPLHIIISQKILEIQKIENFIFIFLIENKSSKNLFYYSTLESKASASLYFVKKYSIFDFARIVWPLLSLRRLVGRGISIYTGNIKTFYSRFIMWFFGKAAIMYSFDDGIGNIKIDDVRANANYFEDKNEILLSKLFFSIVDKSFLYRNITENIREHFTIYDYPNIYSNTRLINLFTLEDVSVKDQKEPLNILLSSALAMEDYLTQKEEIEFYNQLILRYEIDLVIRHPRNETFIPEHPCKVSQSLKIAEHQIIELARTYDLLIVSVFYSSVLINIPRHLKKLNVITKNPKKDHPEFRKFYNEIGIETVSV